MSGSSHTDVMLAGAAAAFTVDLLVYPLDTLKTRQQSRDFLKEFADPSTKTPRLPPRHLFKGLYQGIGIVVVSTLPAAGTFFTVYEASKSLLGSQSSRSSSLLQIPQPLAHSAASAIAECASCLVLTPAEVIKQNAQVLQEQQGVTPPNKETGRTKGGLLPSFMRNSTSLQALRQLGGTGAGPRLLSGYTALVARNLPFTSIQFPIFEFVRARLWARRRTGSGKNNPDHHIHGGNNGSSSAVDDFGNGREKRSLLETGVITGASAGLAGSFAAFVTTPMDVVKTRIMLSAGRRRGADVESEASGGQGVWRSGKGNDRSLGGLAVARQVVSERGVAGLFRGALLRSVWTTVGSGLYLGMYEVAKAWLTRGKGDGDEDAFP
ncbi:mitochondrial carrier domain-containing protein [Xylariaceae sp. FL0594]|nr:mitochondrial carrier domain-containing protein [Xylariaceae sp. FL0594]